MKDEYNILLVDDDVYTTSSVADVLKELGYENIRQPNNPKLALIAIKAGYKPDIVFSDRTMPGMLGEDFLQKVMKNCPTAKRVMLSADNPKDVPLPEGLIHKFLRKPYRLNEIKETLDFLLNQN